MDERATQARALLHASRELPGEFLAETAQADRGQQRLATRDILRLVRAEAALVRLDDLERLAHDVRAAGLDVRVEVRGDPVDLPRGLDLSAYRIVQEALTNSLKHSGADVAEVVVAYSPDELCLQVRDHGRNGDHPSVAVGGGGHGLVGIRERVKLFDGDLETGPAPGGGFLVRARLPLGGAT